MAQVVMPTIGAGTTHGRILRWHKRVGDPVRVGDILAEIETDKAVIELEAFDEGVLQDILVPAGELEVPVGEPIARIRAAGGEAPHAAPAAPPHAGESAQDGGPARATAPMQGGIARRDTAGIAADARRIFASPSARRLARMLDVELAGLRGSGPGGRIVRVDIERAGAAAASSAGERHAEPVADRAADASREAHSSMRKTIARRLQESKQQIPHFYLDMDVRMDALLALRAQLNAGLERQSSALRLSLNDLIVYVAAQAVAQSPDINVRWTEDALEYHRSVDVSVAVATERGLITPVLRDVAPRRLGALAAELHELLERAHAGRLSAEQYQGGGFTVSNLGMFGVSSFSAIINPPQAAILAVGAVEKRPVAEGDAVGVAQVMTVTLSADHRAVDGATAARFLGVFRDLAQNPALMLL